MPVELSGLVISGDLAGFSMLPGDDAGRQLLWLYESFNLAIRGAMQSGTLVACNTWGDAVFAAISNVAEGIEALRTLAYFGYGDQAIYAGGKFRVERHRCVDRPRR